MTEKTLIVGVDVAKEKHHARVFDYKGVEYGKRLEFENNREGMEKFLAWAMDLMRKNEKDHLMVGMEPTCHYWLCFVHYLKNNNVR